MTEYLDCHRRPPRHILVSILTLFLDPSLITKRFARSPAQTSSLSEMNAFPLFMLLFCTICGQ